uniref:MADF domain-containing protein n=1 Tax=Sipha flava TaxID=143950 RepID=A0A2S2Q873_9HEMI
MSELEWTAKQIIIFLNIFQNYPYLWDVTSKDYLNRNFKEVSYNKLLDNLHMSDIPGSLYSLKKKIKSLRDTYRKELQKVQKSKKVVPVQTMYTSQSLYGFLQLKYSGKDLS